MPARESRVVHPAGPGIQGCASSTGPQAIAAANRLGVDHLMGFQLGPHRSQLPTGPQGIAAAGHGCIEGTASSPGPQGIAAAGPVGVDHSIELQPGPHKIQGCASCRRMDPGNCIKSRPAGDRSCNPSRSGSICRRSQLLALGSIQGTA
jgi:hypothetical protein